MLVLLTFPNSKKKDDQADHSNGPSHFSEGGRGNERALEFLCLEKIESLLHNFESSVSQKGCLPSVPHIRPAVQGPAQKPRIKPKCLWIITLFGLHWNVWHRLGENGKQQESQGVHRLVRERRHRSMHREIFKAVYGHHDLGFYGAKDNPGPELSGETVLRQKDLSRSSKYG